MTHIEWLQLNSLANKILGEKELLLLDAFPRFTREIQRMMSTSTTGSKYQPSVYTLPKNYRFRSNYGSRDLRLKTYFDCVLC